LGGGAVVKVFVVNKWVAYEGEDTLGVYATRERALEEHPDAVPDPMPCPECGSLCWSDCPCEGTEDFRKAIRRAVSNYSGKVVREFEVKS
jgi:hypothetical protein